MKKMNFKIFVLLVITSIFLFSCNRDDLFEVASNTDKLIVSDGQIFRLTEEEAVKNLQSFLNELDKSSEGSVSTRSKPVRIIKNVQAVGKNEKEVESLIDDGKLSLRGLLSAVQTDTILYIINFEDAGGFAIVSADKRANKVYAIIDEGALDVNEINKFNNPGFNMFMDDAIVSELSDIETYDLSSLNNLSFPSMLIDITINKPSLDYVLLKTKWGQDYPYNIFCPNGSTGCVPTAIAQIYSYYQPINAVNYYDRDEEVNRSSNLTWSKIISDCENASIYGVLTNGSAPQSSLQVAHLMRYIGIGVKAYYYEDGRTISNTAMALDFFRKNGFPPSIRSQDYDSEVACDALSERYLIYVSGTSNHNSYYGHAWVLDGAIKARYPNKETVDYYMHCNWGWDGIYDGYYLDFDLSDSFISIPNIDRPKSSNEKYTAKKMVIMKR